MPALQIRSTGRYNPLHAHARHFTHAQPQPQLSNPGIGEPVAEFRDRWDVGQIYDPAEIALDAEVPTQVVTGGLDHVTPPEIGEQVQDALSVSHLIEVEEAVHAPLEALSLPGTCGQRIVTDFLDDPYSAPDATCATDFALQLDAPLPPGLG